jgi:hypothetical protein
VLPTAVIVPKDYGIMPLARSSPQAPFGTYSVSFWRVQYPLPGFLFSPFFFWKKAFRERGEREKQLTKFFNAKTFRK